MKQIKWGLHIIQIISVGWKKPELIFSDRLDGTMQNWSQLGIISPVIAVNCKYKKSTTFEDVIDIDVIVEEFKEVKLKLQYTMTNAQGEIVCQGYSEHGFINPEGKLIRLKREYPDFYHALSELAE